MHAIIIGARNLTSAMFSIHEQQQASKSRSLRRSACARKLDQWLLCIHASKPIHVIVVDARKRDGILS